MMLKLPDSGYDNFETKLMRLESGGLDRQLSWIRLPKISCVSSK